MKSNRKTALACAACLAFTGTAAALPEGILEDLPLVYAAENNWSLDENGTLTIKTDFTNWDYPWSVDTDSIRKIIIEPGVTRIGEWAFQVCRNLTEVSIPDTVTKIGDGAFSSCPNLKTITLPKNLTELGRQAFSGCSALKTINISNKSRI